MQLGRGPWLGTGPPPDSGAGSADARPRRLRRGRVRAGPDRSGPAQHPRTRLRGCGRVYGPGGLPIRVRRYRISAGSSACGQPWAVRPRSGRNDRAVLPVCPPPGRNRPRAPPSGAAGHSRAVRHRRAQQRLDRTTRTAQRSAVAGSDVRPDPPLLIHARTGEGLTEGLSSTAGIRTGTPTWGFTGTSQAVTSRSHHGGPNGPDNPGHYP
jgi:hypothetical protein